MGRMRTIRKRTCGGVGVVLLLVLLPFATRTPLALAASPPGQVMDFGENIWGQLGNGGTANGDPNPQVVTLAGLDGSPVQVAAGTDHNIVLTSGGQIYTFGVSGLGSGNRYSEFRMPVAITLPGATGPPVQAAAGVSFSMVLTASGQLYTFGYNGAGQLGNGTSSYEEDPTPTPITLPGATGLPTQIAAGRESSLVLTASGQLYTFGGDSQGELGDGGSYFNPTPEAITLPGATGPPVQVAAGEYHSLVSTSSGQLYTFGEGHFGQLGNGSTQSRSTPEQITLPGATGGVVQIAAGWEHSLALTSSGQLYAFGNDEHGQLGNGVSDDEPHPTPEVVTLPGAVGSIEQIAAGREDSLVVTSSGQLYAFGSNQYGQLGNGKLETAAHPIPTLVEIPPVMSVAPGSSANDTLVITYTPLAVATKALPEGIEGTAYTTTVAANGGTPPLHWSATGLPSGLSIDPASGQISGTPTQAGRSTVKLTVTDAHGVEAQSAPLILLIATLPAPPVSNNPPVAVPVPPDSTGNAASGANVLGGSNDTLSGAGNALIEPPAPGPASGTLEEFDAKHAAVTLTLICNGTGGPNCDGDITLTAHERLRGSRVLALSAANRTTPIKTKVLRLAASSYVLPAGTRGTVTLTLDAAARRLLTARGVLPATLTVSGTITTTRTLDLKAAKRPA
jgi:alpha-tubulin suppressor-like RCC1 family protein